MSEIPDIDVEALVIEVASCYDPDSEAFNIAAAEAAARLEPLGTEGAEILLDMLDPVPDVPEDLEGEIADEDWAAMCGAAVVAMLYELETDGIEALFGIAVGHEGGPEDLATRALFQLANEGVEAIGILKRLARAMLEFGDAAMLAMFIDVRRTAPDLIDAVMPELIDAVTELIDNMLKDDVESEQVIAAMNELVSLAPTEAEPYAPMLREWVLRGVSYGPDSENYTESDVPIMEWCAIRAALVLHRIYPNDLPIRSALDYWRETHVNEEIRAMIAEAVGEGGEGEG